MEATDFLRRYFDNPFAIGIIFLLVLGTAILILTGNNLVDLIVSVSDSESIGWFLLIVALAVFILIGAYYDFYHRRFTRFKDKTENRLETLESDISGLNEKLKSIENGDN